jgi:uncharacterized protein (TIGR02391 family)
MHDFEDYLSSVFGGFYHAKPRRRQLVSYVIGGTLPGGEQIEMPAIHEMIPDPEILLALEPEELAPVLLQYICSGSAYAAGTPQQPIKRGNVFTGSATPGNAYGQQYKGRVDDALMAAWFWLEREGLLLTPVGQHDRDWVCVTPRGRSLLSKENFDAYRHSLLFPRRTLHPAIASSTLPLFIRGHYDTVVFEAFRAVEVAVRDAAKLPQAMVGTGLMRTAFALNSGPLTDTSLVAAEQQATADLFAGAMGLFKNPTSHRIAAISKPEDAVDLVMLANYLLRLVEQRVK